MFGLTVYVQDSVLYGKAETMITDPHISVQPSVETATPLSDTSVCFIVHFQINLTLKTCKNKTHITERVSQTVCSPLGVRFLARMISFPPKKELVQNWCSL